MFTTGTEYNRDGTGTVNISYLAQVNCSNAGKKQQFLTMEIGITAFDFPSSKFASIFLNNSADDNHLQLHEDFLHRDKRSRY